MDETTLQTFEKSLGRCTAKPEFLDLFYDTFLASSPKVREKFVNTDFATQKRALRASFNLMLRAAKEQGSGPPLFLEDLAQRHGARHLAIGAELYDLWLDSLLSAVHVCDPDWSEDIDKVWEKVMGVGIGFLCTRYNE